MFWSEISKYQKLSEDFIREFKDRVNWNCISEYQELSYEFILEHISLIKVELLDLTKFNRNQRDNILILKQLVS